MKRAVEFDGEVLTDLATQVEDVYRAAGYTDGPLNIEARATAHNVVIRRCKPMLAVSTLIEETLCRLLRSPFIPPGRR